MFPENNPEKKEKFVVNFARSEKYFKSAIPQCQRALNDFFQEKEKNAILKQKSELLKNNDCGTP